MPQLRLSGLGSVQTQRCQRRSMKLPGRASSLVILIEDGLLLPARAKTRACSTSSCCKSSAWHAASASRTPEADVPRLRPRRSKYRQLPTCCQSELTCLEGSGHPVSPLAVAVGCRRVLRPHGRRLWFDVLHKVSFSAGVAVPSFPRLQHDEHLSVPLRTSAVQFQKGADSGAT